MLPSCNREETGRQHHLREEDKPPFLLLPKPESKPLNRKSLKKLSSFSCSKRPQTDQANDIIITAAFEDHKAKKIRYDNIIQGRSDEKCRIVRQKRGQDYKKTDKKSIKANGNTRFDPFTLKARIIGSDTTSGGNDIIGIQDVTKHVEELSLDELLSGSYYYRNLCVQRGKKAPNSNEIILFSVRNACSFLPNPCSPKTNISDSAEKDKCIEESSSKAESSSSSVCHPKDILQRLALPPIQNLEAPILKDFCRTSLLLCHWSYILGGDSCKLTLPRNASQSKWLRIRRCSTPIRDENNSFSIFDLEKLDLELKTLGLNDGSANGRETESGALDNHVHYEFRDNAFQSYSKSEVGSRCLEIVDPSKFDSPYKESEVGKTERTIDGFSGSCHGYLFGESLWNSSTQEICKSVHSPNMLAAASILCEMAQNDAAMRTKLLKTPSNKNPVDHKSSSSSVEKTEKPFVASWHHDTFKHPASPSMKHTPISQRNHVLSTQLEKVYNHHLKHRQEKLNASPFGFRGTWIKDWSSERSKRV